MHETDWYHARCAPYVDIEEGFYLNSGEYVHMYVEDYNKPVAPPIYCLG